MFMKRIRLLFKSAFLKKYLPIFFIVIFPLFLTAVSIIDQVMPYINGKVNSYSTFTLFTVVEESNNAIRFSNKNKPLYKGDKITGEFTASENNLGLVLVRLFNYNKTNSGQVSFILKEKTDNSLNYLINSTKSLRKSWRP